VCPVGGEVSRNVKKKKTFGIDRLEGGEGKIFKIFKLFTPFWGLMKKVIKKGVPLFPLLLSVKPPFSHSQFSPFKISTHLKIFLSKIENRGKYWILKTDWKTLERRGEF
jgi:hypothetical protein